MIAAMANERVIGADNDMPWHLPADLAHFKRVTMGKPIVMGRKTFQSIGRALPGRKNVVISRDKNFKADGVMVVESCEAAIAALSDCDEMMVIGGGTVYQHFLAECDRLYLTFIEHDVAGDTYFPDYLATASWREVSVEAHHADGKNPYNYQFVCLEKQSPAG